MLLMLYVFSVRLLPVVPCVRITLRISRGNTFHREQASQLRSTHQQAHIRSVYQPGDYESGGRLWCLPISCAPTAPHDFMLSGASQVSRLMRGNGPGFCGSDMPASGGAGRPSSSIHGTSANRAYVF